MNAYYVAEGEVVTGPFAETQLGAMWQAGAITAHAMVCLEGTEEWVPIRTELNTMEAMKPKPPPAMLVPAPVRMQMPPVKPSLGRRIRDKIIRLAVLVGVALVILVGLALVLSRPMPDEDGYSVRRSLKEWIGSNVADPNARLMAVSDVFTIDGLSYIKARIAGRNALGGPVMSDMVFYVIGGQAQNPMSQEDFSHLMATILKDPKRKNVAKIQRDARDFVASPLRGL